MKRIAVFRYHKEFEIVKERVKLFKLINPGILLYGIYGGERNKYDESNRILGKLFESNYFLDNNDVWWKWFHGDIIYQLWHRDVGQYLRFDVAHIIEWDLLLLDTIENLYGNIDKEALGCTGLVPLKQIEAEWYWIRNMERREEYKKFINYVTENFSVNVDGYGMLGPGISLPRSFLDRLLKIKMVSINTSDELKLPVWAQITGNQLQDNGFYKKWFSKKEKKFFNANEADIKLKTIRRQLKKNNGRRAFHPFRKHFDVGELFQMYKDQPR